MNIFQECKCPYCIEHEGFPVLWELSKDILFLEIPKNGSFTIKRTYPNAIELKEAPAGRMPYVVVRDPVDRFISLVKHYFMKEGARFKKGKPFFAQHGKNIVAMGVEERIDFLIDNLGKLSTAEEVHHFYPQAHFIDTKNFTQFNLINIEDLSKTLDAPVANKTILKTKVMLTEKQTRRIKDIYKDDYKFLATYRK